MAVADDVPNEPIGRDLCERAQDREKILSFGHRLHRNEPHRLPCMRGLVGRSRGSERVTEPRRDNVPFEVRGYHVAEPPARHEHPIRAVAPGSFARSTPRMLGPRDLRLPRREVV